MPENLAELLDLLTLEPLDDRLFRGKQPKTTLLPRMFGGQVAAQALVAAQHTVPADRRVHSLHSYFILGDNRSHSRDSSGFGPVAIESVAGKVTPITP